MFHHLPKFLGILALTAIACVSNPATSQDPPREKSAEPPEVVNAKPAPLPPSPYRLGEDYRYTWIMDGKEFATTVLTLDTVKDANGRESSRLRGRLNYERAGRILTGGSTLHFEGTDLRKPARFRSNLEIAVPNMGSQEEELVVRFEGGKAISSRKTGDQGLTRSEVEVREPTFVLESNCFEHWAIVSPHFRSILEDGTLTFFIPTGSQQITYKVRHERQEKVGAVVRDRWSIRHPSQVAWIWTDEEGRLVEYRQDTLQIILAATSSPKEKDPKSSGAAEGKKSAEKKSAEK